MVKDISCFLYRWSFSYHVHANGSWHCNCARNTFYLTSKLRKKFFACIIVNFEIHWKGLHWLWYKSYNFKSSCSMTALGSFTQCREMWWLQENLIPHTIWTLNLCDPESCTLPLDQGAPYLLEYMIYATVSAGMLN